MGGGRRRPEPPFLVERRSSPSLPRDRDGTRESRSPGSLAPTSGLWATESRLARFGPTTPTRAGRLADASVDHTEARNNILGCFGRSDRRAQRGSSMRRSIRRRTLVVASGPMSAQIGLHAAAPCSPLNDCHHRSVNAYRIDTPVCMTRMAQRVSDCDSDVPSIRIGPASGCARRMCPGRVPAHPGRWHVRPRPSTHRHTAGGCRRRPVPG